MFAMHHSSDNADATDLLLIFDPMGFCLHAAVALRYLSTVKQLQLCNCFTSSLTEHVRQKPVTLRPSIVHVRLL